MIGFLFFISFILASKFFFSKIIFFPFFFPFYAKAVHVPCFFGSFSSPLENACKSFVVIVAREVNNGILKVLFAVFAVAVQELKNEDIIPAFQPLQ